MVRDKASVKIEDMVKVRKGTTVSKMRIGLDGIGKLVDLFWFAIISTVVRKRENLVKTSFVYACFCRFRSDGRLDQW